MTAARQPKTETTATDKELLKAVPTTQRTESGTFAKRTTEAPAKKATPKPEIKAVPDEQPKAPRTSIKWVFDSEKDSKGRAAQHGTSPINGLTYTITGSDKSWTAVVTGKGQKPQALVENVSHTTAYLASVKHAKGQQSA